MTELQNLITIFIGFLKDVVEIEVMYFYDIFCNFVFEILFFIIVIVSVFSFYISWKIDNHTYGRKTKEKK